MSRVWGGVLAVTGFIACPCHLPVTLPLILGVLGGTGIGGFIGANTGLIYGIFTGYFIVGIGVGVYLLNRKQRNAEGVVCELPEQMSIQRNGRKKQTRKRIRAERRRVKA